MVVWSYILFDQPGKQGDHSGNEGFKAFVAPGNDAQNFHAQIEGSQSLGNGMFNVPCTTDAKIFFQFLYANVKIISSGKKDVNDIP